MNTTQRRLEKLEQRAQAGRGIRVFQQSLDDASTFLEGERSYTRAEISAIGAQGWQTIIVLYYGGSE